jgi:hypothetical protein
MKTKYKNMEKSFVGDEPILKDCDLTISFTKALNWYNYYYDPEEGVDWLYAYLTENNFNKDYINKVKKLSPYDIGITLCSIAKMSLNGTDIGKYADSITKKLDGLIERHEEELKDKPVVSVIDRISVKSNKIIANVEYQIEQFIHADYEDGGFDFYDYFKKNEVSTQVALNIINYYQELTNELEIALDKSDPDISYAYRFHTKRSLSRYIDFVNKIINDAKKLKLVEKAERKSRKPRKHKYKSEAEIVKRLKYAVSYDALKIASVDPITIVNSQSLWVYNTKYKVLGVYYADGPKGISVKGTTLTGFNPGISIGKTLRKPELILTQLMNSSKVRLDKILEGVNTKPTKLNGRINKDTILLRVIK